MEQTTERLGGLTRAQAIDQIWPMFKRIERGQLIIIGIGIGLGAREVLMQFGVGSREVLAIAQRVFGWG